MKFSVITVCKNSESTIGRTLVSVNTQNYSDIEHIIVDGGSNDGTLRIVNDLGFRVSICISEPDSGIYDAMNKGIALAKGDYILFLNSDDYYANDKVISLYAKFVRETNADLVYGDVMYYKTKPGNVFRIYDSSVFSPSRIRFGLIPAHPATCFRKELFARYGYYSPDYRIAGDFEFFARIFSTGGVTYEYIPRIFVCMKWGGASTSGFDSLVQINKEINSACVINGIYTNHFYLFIRYLFKVLEFVKIKI
jgi:glycosyltransferase involved in cell wall biosynthesis